ncbi:protein phosphatase 1 regulatory subunit 12B isoform X3 [Eleutherodactylus coqui]|uniref:protein phosphatase 1 regulatory subunit 12B isoform X3 n=1 Tax=Eleutherodactylus coqui TaxID=57060 RepID=UPI00346235BD
MTEHRWLTSVHAYDRFGSHVREKPSRYTEGLRSSWHDRLPSLDSGGSSLTPADSDRASTRASLNARQSNRLPSGGNKTEEPQKDFKRKQDNSSQVGQLEAEKREKRVLERRMSEMEGDLKVLTDLKSDNQRLKDENGALIRVISKLSK